MISILVLRSLISLNLLFAPSDVTIPERVRIYYDNSAFGILKEEPDDLKSFLKAYQSEVDLKGESIRVTITQALKELNDPSLSNEDKLSSAEWYFHSLQHSQYGMLSISDERYSPKVKLAKRLNEMENNQPAIENPPQWYDVYYVVLLDYKERTDTLTMSACDYLEINYKGKFYQSSPVFFMILDMIRERDPIWKKENDMFYKGHGIVNYDTVR